MSVNKGSRRLLVFNVNLLGSLAELRPPTDPRPFVCILYAVIGDVSVLSFLSVLRVNNLRVCNTDAGSTPVASISFVFNNLDKPGNAKIARNHCLERYFGLCQTVECQFAPYRQALRSF